MMTETVVTVQEAPPHNNAAKPENQGSLGWIKINVLYFKTLPGILKLAQFILGILCMALASPAMLAGTHWFLFVATVSFIATVLWIIIYFFGIREALTLPINWLLTEFLNTTIFAVLYFIAFIVQLAIWAQANPYHPWRGENIAAGVFGLINTLAYGAGALLLYKESKSGNP